MATGKRAAEDGALARLVPSQQRSRERFERILDCAAQLLIEKGSDALRMSDIVERAGVPFGSLYQYFPDKTAVIGTLAQRYNEIGRKYVSEAFAAVKSPRDLRTALGRVVDGYYSLFMSRPVTRDIWRATQADRALQALDEEDMEVLAGFLLGALQRLAPGRDVEELAAIARLTMHLIAAAVRHAITLKPREAERSLALFKAMLPSRLAALA